MANHISHAALPYPIYNARYTILVPYLDADGDPTDPTTPDTEASQDGGAFADTAEEVTTITGSNGVGYITLTATETDVSALALAFKVASGPKATIATLYPRRLPILESGTAQAGAAGSITLASGAIAADIAGCFVRTTGGTGGGTTANQARRITAYNTSTKVATVAPDWETTPDSTTTYDVLCPEGVTPAMLKCLTPTAAGDQIAITANKVGVSNIGVGAFASGAITADAIAADAIGSSEFTQAAADKIWSSATRVLTAGTNINGSTFTAIPWNAAWDAEVESEVNDALVAYDGLVPADLPANFGALSINVSGHIARVVLVDTLTTYTGNTPQTGDVFPLASTEIADIKAKTDNLPTDPADQSLIIAATNAIMTRLGTPAGASVSADILVIDDFLDTEIEAIKAKTDLIPASPAATGDAMALTAAAVDAVLDEVVDGVTTFRQLLRGFASALLAKVSGLPTAPVFRDLADTKNRITATTDTNGNRSAVTTDLT